MSQNTTHKKAFTLIELGIVLIVIGIIIAAVMSGGDVIKSGVTKEFYQTYARKWTTVIDGYYDRMGKELMDSDNDGYFDDWDETSNPNITTDMLDAVRNAGINIDKIIGTNQSTPDKYMIQGEFTDYVITKVSLRRYQLKNYDNTLQMFNFLVIENVPIDIASALDRYVDGISDGTKGHAICIQTDSTTNSLPTDGVEITPVSYNPDPNVLKTTNIGILIEH